MGIDAGLSREDKRNLLTFGLAVVAGGTVVSVVAVISSSKWSEASWAGVGAAAAVVQAAGVLAALSYSSNQVEAMRLTTQLQREHVLLDRIDDVLRYRLEASVARLAAACDAHEFWSAMRSDASDAVARGSEQNLARCENDAVVAWKEADEAVSALLGTASALGIRRHQRLLLVRAAMFICDPQHESFWDKLPPVST